MLLAYLAVSALLAVNLFISPSWITVGCLAFFAALGGRGYFVLFGRVCGEIALAGAERALAASQKELFSVKMDAIWRDALPAACPQEVDEKEFFAGLPDVDSRAVQIRWDHCAAEICQDWKAPLAAELDKHRDVHPVIAAVLNAVVSRSSMRVWASAPSADDVPCVTTRSAFTVTHICDAPGSQIGGLLAIEIERPGRVKIAVYKTCATLRRRVGKICSEREARGESCHDVFALGVATDGHHVVFVWVASGAPAPGRSFENAEPFPARHTAPLALFSSWTFAFRPDFRRTAPPGGFAALTRLVAVPMPCIAEGIPLDHLDAILIPGLELEAPVGNFASIEVALTLGNRVGCGGTSDVYELEGGFVLSGKARRAVVKVARSTTSHVTLCYEAERKALVALRDAAAQGLVPELAGVGHRKLGVQWPLLVLLPLGQQLADWVWSCVTRASFASVSSRFRVRRSCARIVALRVLDALAASHAMNIIHCDVRPQNIIVADGLAVLADWGISRMCGTRASYCGVDAHALRDVFTRSYKAQPAQDIAGVLYTWLSIAYDSQCNAPWLHHRSFDDTDVFDSRSTWIRTHESEDATVAAVAAALRVIESSENMMGGAELATLARAAVEEV